MNAVTPGSLLPRPAERRKTTTSLGLLAALQKVYPRIGYIKPVGPAFHRSGRTKNRRGHDPDGPGFIGWNCPLSI